MADVFMELSIHSSQEAVFKGVSTPDGLAKWWTIATEGNPVMNALFKLDFGPEYQWEAKIIEYLPNTKVTFLMTKASADWLNTEVGFQLERQKDSVLLRFSHCKWPDINQEYRGSVYCWAMYLRCLKNYLEQGVFVAYENRYNG
ncbi:hypothetical protein GWK08_10945 [Leptobacterium flavescens]|uniref:Activator of Hsp90 ATPase homologue 1/2-like C-terminal domain-containing protein n=1 Tax=Leptobacterium flavescens TaxID=472055 RepID=A0A6P0UQ57_9FLAO|nr:SRPBCC domain-containing protein [Leptobacterium flavescens]NER13959.1 hypothetical protein [Leptobacterium flavescens]